MESKKVLFRSKPVHYRIKGNGFPVVLLHGFGETANVWALQEDAFPGNQLILPEWPGSGASPLNDDVSMEGLAAAVAAVLDAESTGQCIVIGHSMGGYAALAFAEKYPERLAGLGLFHSSAFADTEEKKETRRKGIDFIKANGAAAFLKTTIPNLYSQKTKKDQPQLVASHIASAADLTPEALIDYYEAMIARPDRTNVWKDLESPALFIMGKEDAAVPLADGLKQAHLPRIVHVHLLEDVAHMGMREAPEASNRFLSDFIRFCSSNVPQ